jgi:hypothetical protein
MRTGWLVKASGIFYTKPVSAGDVGRSIFPAALFPGFKAACIGFQEIDAALVALFGFRADYFSYSSAYFSGC